MGRRFSFLTCAFSTILLSLFSSTISACDCQTAHAISMGVPSYGGVAIAQAMYGPMAMYGPTAASGIELPLSPAPRGTLGQTYTRPSHPVPVDEHPRTGMLAVRDNGSIQFLSVQTMGGIKMKSGIWLFETKRPLDPGACQIVRVEARTHAADIEPYETRFVRLIPGRIVYLDF